jgi:hypothetical protein
MIRSPYDFEDGSDLLRFRDRLLVEVQTGRMTQQRFRARIKSACKRYNKDARARECARQLAVLQVEDFARD